jgi:cytidyltransferase-related domain
MSKKVFVSGCYDLLHSGHIEFFRQAAQFGDLYVGIGSDETYWGYKHRRPVCDERERLFMVKAIRYVKDAFINAGSGVMDFLPTLDIVHPDVLVVNEDGACEEKRRVCEQRGMEYVVLQRKPAQGLKARSSTDLKKQVSGIPTRLDLAGTWIDQPYVSKYAPGWALTISVEPTFEVRERCGLATSTRKLIQQIWPLQLPDMNPETLARLVFCYENNPERADGIISGAQDAIGICVPGLCRHWYNGHYWPERIEICEDEGVISWLESHLVLAPMEPRAPECSVVDGMDVTEWKVRVLASAASSCWEAILSRDLPAFTQAYQSSFEAQVAMFPGMVQGTVPAHIERWARVPGVLAWKMPGAGGGGYLALIVQDVAQFCKDHGDVTRLIIRRAGK